MKAVRIAVAALFALAAACGGSKDSTAPAPISASAAWNGFLTNTSGTTAMWLTLVASTSSVTGNGGLLNPALPADGGISASVIATGTYSQPNIALTLNETGYQPIALVATVYADSMVGTLNGSGFVNQTFKLTRQP